MIGCRRRSAGPGRGRRRAGQRAPARRAARVIFSPRARESPGLQREVRQQLLELLLVLGLGHLILSQPQRGDLRSSASRCSTSARSAGSAFAISTVRDRGGARNSVAANLPSPPSSSVACSVRMLPLCLVRRGHLRLRVVERFEHRHAAVAVAIGGVAVERLDEEAREPRLVAFAAGLGRGDDGARRAGQRREERAARARGVDERDALGRQLVEQLRVVAGGQIGTGQVEGGAGRRSCRGRSAGRTTSSFGFARAARSAKALVTFSRVERRLCAPDRARPFGEIGDVGVGDAALLRRVDDRGRPFVELRRVLLVAGDAGDDEQVHVLRGGRTRSGASENEPASARAAHGDADRSCQPPLSAGIPIRRATRPSSSDAAAPACPTARALRRR